MLARLRPRRPSHGTVVAYLALFVALSTGGAYAANTVFSEDIVDGEVKTPDIANAAVVTDKLAQGAVTSGKVKNENLTGGDVADESLTGFDVADNTLGGADIDESALGQVPSATLGGYGRYTGNRSCDPDSATYVDCGFVTLNLPAQNRGAGTRVLVIGAVTALPELPDADAGHGTCRIATSLGSLPASELSIFVKDRSLLVPAGSGLPLTAITPPLGPGSVDFGVECNQATHPTKGAGTIQYRDISISAVAISPN